MIVVNLKGALGNQLFQYAAGRALALEKGTDLKLQVDHYDPNKRYLKEIQRRLDLDCFNVKFDVATTEEINRVKYPYPGVSNLLAIVNSYLLAHDYIKLPIILNKNSKDIYLDGHFQSEDFFKKYSDIIREEFTFKKELESEYFNNFVSEIRSQKNKSVAIHVRRGDYVTNKYANKHHGTLDGEYYEKALDVLRKKYGKIKPYVFTEFFDEIKWVKENIPSLEKDTVFVKESQLTDPQSFVVMSKCAHNIIANSSYSWWAAWLNSNKDKTVIAPKKWLRKGDGRNKRIVPESWIRV